MHHRDCNSNSTLIKRFNIYNGKHMNGLVRYRGIGPRFTRSPGVENGGRLVLSPQQLMIQLKAANLLMMDLLLK